VTHAMGETRQDVVATLRRGLESLLSYCDENDSVIYSDESLVGVISDLGYILMGLSDIDDDD